MITSAQCQAKYGSPETEKFMVLWDVPAELEIGTLPNRLYCNRDMVAPLTQAFKNIISRGLVDEIKTWDGCFNIRNKRNGVSRSLHSWGIAIDINASWNKMGHPPTMSKELVACFEEAGFDWGGRWSKPDGMHFQLRSI
jgi:hypothetical protein